MRQVTAVDTVKMFMSQCGETRISRHTLNTQMDSLLPKTLIKIKRLFASLPYLHRGRGGLDHLHGVYGVSLLADLDTPDEPH